MSESPDSWSDADLREWIRDHPHVWDYAWPVDVNVEADIDRIVDRVVAEKAAPVRHARRSRRRVIVGVCAVVGLTGGAVAAAAVLRSGQPTRPEAGTACRAEPRLDSGAIVLEPGQDPLSGCLTLWQDGAFVKLSTIRGVPDLIACVDPNGPINVFPGSSDLCAQLKLEPADTRLSPDNDAIVALQDQLSAVNLADCQTADQVVAEVKQILAKSGLEGWRVAIGPGSENAVCAKAGVDSSTRTITVNQL